MKKIILTILLSTYFTIVFSQNKKPLIDSYLDCIYESENINRDKVEFQIAKFEKFLLEKGILKDTKARGYEFLMQTIFEDKEKKVDYSFIDSIRAIPNTQSLTTKNNKCLAKIERVNEKQIKNKTKILQTVDFSSRFYKLRVLLAYNTDGGLEADKELSNISSIIKINISSKGELFHDNLKYNLEGINSLLKKFFENSKDGTILISLNADKDLLYRDYLNVINNFRNVIKEAQNNKSQELFNIEYEKLNEVQKASLDKKFKVAIKDSSD